MAGNPRSIRPTLRASAGALALLALVGLFVATASPMAILGAQDSPKSPATPTSTGQPAPAATPAMPRGKKLMLTDGTFQLVRVYKVEGDRVRYYSIDSSQWEQIPLAMVDWEATKK